MNPSYRAVDHGRPACCQRSEAAQIAQRRAALAADGAAGLLGVVHRRRRHDYPRDFGGSRLASRKWPRWFVPMQPRSRLPFCPVLRPFVDGAMPAFKAEHVQRFRSEFVGKRADRSSDARSQTMGRRRRPAAPLRRSARVAVRVVDRVAIR